MSGSFSSLNTALSALRYNRMAMDVASANIANLGTKGYARRQISSEAVGAPAQPAMWSRWDGAGDGVRVASVDRMTDLLLDVRARIEHGNQSYLDTRAAVLDRVEAGIGEPGDNGVAAALVDFREGWHDVANNDTARSQLLARANTLTTAINSQARNVTTEASDQRAKLQALVAEVNTVASDLAVTNKNIVVAKVNGTDAGILLDQRDQLAMRLSELTGATAKQGPDGNLDVSIGGVTLVSGSTANKLVISTGVTAGGDADGSPVTLGVLDPSTSATTAVPAGSRGEIGAVTDVLNTTLPDYLEGLNEVVRTLADQVNTQHGMGYDAAGVLGQDFFSFDATNPALTLTVAITDVNKVAASGQPGGVVDGSNARALGALDGAEAAYQQMVTGFGSDVASARRLAANQQVLTQQIDGSREQLSGVSLDEEVMALMSHQRAFEAASRVISTIDSMLDTLINRTGLLR